MTGTGAPPGRPADFLERAERYAGRSFERRDDLSRLLRAAADPEGAKLFDELLFLSKFSHRAIAIVRRTGPGSEEVAKLTAELASATTRITEILRRLLGTGGEGPPGDAGTVPEPRDHASFARLQSLIGELAVLKNYELDEGGK